MDERRLRDVPLFADLSKGDRQAVASCADEIDARAGKELVTQGNFAYEFFVIEDGTAEVLLNGEVVAELGPGEFFGEIGALDKVRRTATVTAKSDMELIVMTSQSIRRLLSEQPDVAERVREAIEARLPQTSAGQLAD